MPLGRKRACQSARDVLDLSLERPSAVARREGKGAAAGAARHYRRAGDIWRKVHGDEHYLNAIAISNLASIELEKGRMENAESMMRDACARFVKSLGEENSNTGIARLKLGRVLLRRGKHADAERELLAGLSVLEKQMEPTSPWLQTGRKDLAEARQAIARAR